MGQPPGRPRAVGGRGQRLAAAIRTVRAQRGMTRELLAERARLSPNTVGAVEQGRVADPGFFTVAALAQALSVGLDELAERSRQQGGDAGALGNRLGRVRGADHGAARRRPS